MNAANIKTQREDSVMTNKTTTKSVSRRGFIATCSAAAAVLTVPKIASGKVSAGWANASPALLEQLRAAYLAEVERFAETLRPRFEAGELRAINDTDMEDGEQGGTSPHWRIEEACAEHFGIKAEKRSDTWRQEGPQAFRGDMAAAHMVLAASPHTESTADNFHHPCHHAEVAAAWDVIALARSRGWYTPSPDECADPIAFQAEVAAAEAQS